MIKNTFFNLSLEDEPICQLACRYLLAGKAIYYSDSILSRIGEYNSTIRPNQIHEFGKTLFMFIQENYSDLKCLMKSLGYSLIRDRHNLSMQPEYNYYFYLEPLDLPTRIKEEKFSELQAGDALILSALILLTNNGTLFINYEEEFKKRLLEEPRKILKADADISQVAKTLMPRAKKIGNDEHTRNRLQSKIDERIRSILFPLNYVQIIQNEQKQTLISLGPKAFQFTRLLREQTSFENINPIYEQNYRKTDIRE